MKLVKPTGRFACKGGDLAQVDNTRAAGATLAGVGSHAPPRKSSSTMPNALSETHTYYVSRWQDVTYVNKQDLEASATGLTPRLFTSNDCRFQPITT